MSAARILVIASRHGQPSRGRRVQHRHRRALAHRHGFAAVAVVAVQAHGDVGHGHLPGSHHLVAADHAADGAVADGDQERLVGDRRQTQQPIERLGDRRPRGREFRSAPCARVRTSRVMRGALPSSTSMGISTGVADSSESVTSRRPSAGDLPHHGIGTALALAQRGEQRHASPGPAPARSAPAPRCTRSPSATIRTRRSESCASRCARRAGCARSPRARRSTVRRRRRRESAGWDSHRPWPKQRSMTSWARR